MKLTPELLRDGCEGLARELTRLSQLNRPLSLDDFSDWASREEFIKNLFSKYGEFIKGLSILDSESKNYCADLAEYMENAIARYDNAVTYATYGITDSAYLFAINILFSVYREADNL
ncbi:hypothetical protein AB8849_07335 [Proteus vulgaris]